MENKEDYMAVLEELSTKKLVWHDIYDDNLKEFGIEYQKLFIKACRKHKLEPIKYSELLTLSYEYADKHNLLFKDARRKGKTYILGITLPPKKNEHIDITQDVVNFINEYNYTIDESGSWIECNELYVDYIGFTELDKQPTRTAFTQALAKLNVVVKFKKNKERKTIRVYTNIFKQKC